MLDPRIDRGQIDRELDLTGLGGPIDRHLALLLVEPTAIGRGAEVPDLHVVQVWVGSNL